MASAISHFFVHRVHFDSLPMAGVGSEKGQSKKVTVNKKESVTRVNCYTRHANEV